MLCCWSNFLFNKKIIYSAVGKIASESIQYTPISDSAIIKYNIILSIETLKFIKIIFYFEFLFEEFSRQYDITYNRLRKMVIDGITNMKKEVSFEYPRERPFMFSVRLKALQISSSIFFNF